MANVYILLGMHKSGTTLVSRLLQSCEIDMVDGEDHRTYDEGNQFERKVTKQINKSLLKCEGMHSIELPKRLNTANVPDELRFEAQNYVETMRCVGRDWGFKDPRTCLTYAFWNQIIPSHKLVVVFRDVNEVHGRYSSKARLGMFRGVRALKAWYTYNQACLNAYLAADPRRRILLNYGDLMRDNDEFDRLTDFAGHKSTDLRSRSLNRSAASPALKLWIDSTLYKFISGHDVFALQNRLHFYLENETRM